MRLKKIELFGFKSFADKTQIVFDDGVTCIVGPNGCGKSNISDSIRWVLGERSAKLLRGSKMDDVIFNGTDFRKPQGYAEVSLVIDNADRGLPIDYQEVTITRRLYRSGESEYLINKTACRLKDIQDLILDTGIGSNSYSMIEQGRIDYILNADADERRSLIEEAAGISKYKVRKDEAIRKLERTEENRLRLNDIIHEVQKNIQYAERQAKRAARYREEHEKLKRLETQKAFFDIAALKQRFESLAAETHLKRREIGEREEKANTLTRDQDALHLELLQSQERFSRQESTRYGLQSERDQALQQLAFHQDKRLEIASRRGQISQEDSQILARLEAGRQEVSARQMEIETLRTEKESARTDLENVSAGLKAAERESDEIKQRLNEIKGEIFNLAAHNARQRSEYHRLQAFLESADQQKRKQTAALDRLRQEAGRWESQKETYGSEIRDCVARLEALTARKVELDGAFAVSKTRLEELESALDQSNRELHEKQAALDILEEIDASFKASDSALMSASEHFDAGLVRGLREILEIQPGYEWALEAALDSFSRALVAENRESARVLISRILEQKASPMGVFIRLTSDEPSGSEHPFPASETGPKIHPEIACCLADWVTVKPGYAHLFETFFRKTFILNPISLERLLLEILPLADETRFLTPEGLVVGPARRIFSRNMHHAAEDNIFKRQREILSLGQDLEKTRLEIARLEELKAEAQADAEKIQKERERFESERLEVSLQREAFESMRRGLEDRLGSFQREFELMGLESRQMDQENGEAEGRKTRLGEELLDSENRERKLHEFQHSLSHDLDKVEARRSEMLQNFAAQKARYGHFEDQERLISDSMRLIRDQERHDLARREALTGELQTLEAKEKQIAEDDARISARVESLREALFLADIALEKERAVKLELEGRMQSLEESMRGLLQEQQQIQRALHDLEMQEMNLGFQEQNIRERMLQAYKLSLADLNPADYAFDGTTLEDVEAEIARLKERVEALGTVNLLAIDEYEELKTRYDFLMNQQKDMDLAREQLLETIRKINKTTKSLFEETFVSVQTAFQEYYQTLFRGGHAKLVLVDETNPLESGIDIVVRPPGKKLQHMTLLSGGEKALTAIALLFALFKIKPSPFCVLDEVDAPLDEANIDRFLAVLKTFLAMTQFIIVTHNRKTIVMGDSLYGVTMQEPGISKIVSVKVGRDGISSPQNPPAEPLQEEVHA